MTTADRLMAVLALFSSEKNEWSVEEAAHEVQLSPSTTYRYFRTLAEAEFIVATGAGRYVLGPAIIMLDRQMRRSDPLIRAAVQVTQSIEQAVDVPGIVLVCRLFQERVMCVHSLEVGASNLHVSYERGRPMPLFRGAASKVILANLPARTVRRLFNDDADAFDKAGLGSDWSAIKRALRLIRNEGSCVVHGEIDAGVVGVASPLFRPDGDVMGSLGLVCSEAHADAVRNGISRVIKRLAREVTQDIARRIA